MNATMNPCNNKWSIWCSVASPMHLNSLHSVAEWKKRLNNEVTNSFITHTHTSRPYSQPKHTQTQSPSCVCIYACVHSLAMASAFLLLLTTGLAQRLLTYSRDDVNKCGLVGANRSDIVHKSLIAPNNHSSIMIF